MSERTHAREHGRQGRGRPFAFLVHQPLPYAEASGRLGRLPVHHVRRSGRPRRIDLRRGPRGGAEATSQWREDELVRAGHVLLCTDGLVCFVWVVEHVGERAIGGLLEEERVAVQ